MRRVRVNQLRPDCVEIHEGRAWASAALCVALFATVASVLEAISNESAAFVPLVALSMIALPIAAVRFKRALRATTRSLVRTPGRLLLDGEPLELARVELRLTHFPLTSIPTGYALSLWMMTATGPEDLSLGRFASMLDATPLSGLLEEFVQRASVRQPGRTPLT